MGVGGGCVVWGCVVGGRGWWVCGTGMCDFY